LCIDFDQKNVLGYILGHFSQARLVILVKRLKQTLGQVWVVKCVFGVTDSVAFTSGQISGNFANIFCRKKLTVMVFATAVCRVSKN
jgi:uncharacterized membrane protein